MHVYYSSSYVGSAHDFETTRKAEWIAHSFDDRPITDSRLIEPQPLSIGALAQVHDSDYVRAVRTGEPRDLAESQGFRWDPGLWPMVLSSNGGAVDAVVDALQHGVSGSLSSGLHHARRGRGAGYCTFNGLAIAGRQALDAGAESVLILDLDAHCGGGTASLIEAEERLWQVDVSVSRYDSYVSTDRASLSMVADAERYLDEIERSLMEVAQRGPRFGLCIYNAGMDPFEGCGTGGLTGITYEMLAARERLVFEWCRERGCAVAFVLAGGYLGDSLTAPGLVDLHRLTLTAAAESR